VSTKLNFDWFHAKIVNDILRIKLKRCLFKYPSSAASVIVTDGIPRPNRENDHARHRKKKIGDNFTICRITSHTLQRAFTANLSP
jgi:hypothetical protein